MTGGIYIPIVPGITAATCVLEDEIQRSSMRKLPLLNPQSTLVL